MRIGELLRQDYCSSCGEEIQYKGFKDLYSKEEFVISGFCQDCQDITFK